MFSRSESKMEDVKVVILTSSQERGNKTILNVDIVPEGSVSKTLKDRQKEGYSCALESMVGGKSPVLNLKEGENVIFDISGALKPQKDFVSGQNELEFRKKTVCCRHFVLVDNEGDDSTSAEITFRTGTRFLHQVNIDVSMHQVHGSPVAAVAPTRQTSIPSGQTAKGRQVMSPLSLTPGDSMNSGTTDGVFRAGELGTRDGFGDDCAVSDQLESLDVRDEERKVGEVAPQQRQMSDESFQDTAHKKILGNKSLGVLSQNLAPSDARMLFVGLGIQDTQYQTTLAQHPHDYAGAFYILLQLWRKNNEGLHNTAKQSITILVKEFKEIGRNDIASRIMTVIGENRELNKDDFKQ